MQRVNFERPLQIDRSDSLRHPRFTLQVLFQLEFLFLQLIPALFSIILSTPASVMFCQAAHEPRDSTGLIRRGAGPLQSANGHRTDVSRADAVAPKGVDEGHPIMLPVS